jgi:hypothetical protein
MSNKLLDQNYQIPKLNSPPNIKPSLVFIFCSVNSAYWLFRIHRDFVVDHDIYVSIKWN